MACGNNHITRDYLKSQPEPVALPMYPPSDQKSHAFVFDDGRVATTSNPDGARDYDKHRHVHVIYNADDVAGRVMVQVTDRTIPGQMDLPAKSSWDEFSQGKAPRGTERQGHHELTVFFRQPSQRELNEAVEDARTAMNSRARQRAPK